MSEKSLQININSVDDARAVVQHLQKVKKAYDAHGCTSVELVIDEAMVTETAGTLAGAIPWCTTFRRIVKVAPIDGNVLFRLPHYQHLERRPVPALNTDAGTKAPPSNGHRASRRIPPRPQRRKPSVSPAPLVQAPPDGA